MRKMVMSIVMLAAVLVAHVDCSAIPMWEFLTRDEKISHLYRLFSRQVNEYCQDSTMPDCSKNLLVSGLRQLAHMDDNQLDILDPYQRGANDMIWRAIVRDNRYASRVNEERQDPYLASDSDPLATSDSDHNRIGEESVHVNDYVRPSEHYLAGPMVIRVFPDGRPVPEDKNRPLPKDEDLEELKFSRVPSVSEVESSNERQIIKKAYPSVKRTAIKPIYIAAPSRYYRAPTNPWMRNQRSEIPVFRYF